MQVAQNTVVALRYCMKNSNGDILENILGGAPVEYLHGSNAIMPALQKSLDGLKAGAVRKINISGENDAQLNGAFRFDVIIDNVREATAEEIALGKPAKPVSQSDCGPGCCC